MVRFSTLVKLYGTPKNSTLLTAEEYSKASSERRILTVMDDGTAYVGEHRVCDVSSRYVFPATLMEQHIGDRVIGVGCA